MLLVSDENEFDGLEGQTGVHEDAEDAEQAHHGEILLYANQCSW